MDYPNEHAKEEPIKSLSDEANRKPTPKVAQQLSEAAYWAAVKDDFKMFSVQAFMELNPGTQFLDNWHLDAIINTLELTIEGKIRRLIINLPPRNLKSFLISVSLPAFLLALDPSTKIICVSYSDELAKDLARQTRRILLSKWYQALFPQVRLLKSSETDIETTQGGARFATSVGGTLTGKGGNIIIVDDPSKPVSIHGDKTRLITNSWYRNTLLSRLDDKKYGAIIVVMQRLHVNDLTGDIQDDGSYHRLVLPAIGTRTETIALRHGQTHTRHKGEVLHPEFEGPVELDRLRSQIGEFLFAAQYQQNPETPEGGLFKLKYLPTYEGSLYKTRDGYYCVSFDTALSTSQWADYTAITVAYVSDDKINVLDVQRGRWDYEEIKKRTNQLIQRMGPGSHFIVEKSANGHALLTYLMQIRSEARIGVWHYPPLETKIGRAAQVLPHFEQQRIRLIKRPGQDAWIVPLQNELTTFPNGKYDDQVDSLVQLVYFAANRKRPNGWAMQC